MILYQSSCHKKFNSGNNNNNNNIILDWKALMLIIVNPRFECSALLLLIVVMISLSWNSLIIIVINRSQTGMLNQTKLSLKHWWLSSSPSGFLNKDHFLEWEVSCLPDNCSNQPSRLRIKVYKSGNLKIYESMGHLFLGIQTQIKLMSWRDTEGS